MLARLVTAPMQETSALRRSIGLSQATAMVVGIIIGASIFVQPSEITRDVRSAPGILLVWLVAGTLTFAGALVAAELSSAFPQTGGVYVFLKSAFSPAIGFLWGWAMFWCMHSGIVAAIAVIFARYVAHFAPVGDAGVRAIAIGAIIALSGVNYLGVRQGSAIQTAFTMVKLLAIALVTVAAFALRPASPAVSPVLASPANVGFHDFTFAVVAGLFAFGGWHMVTYAAGETIRPQRTIPLALILGTLVVTACYIALNAAYLAVLPLERVASSTQIAADAADAVIGGGGGDFMAALVIFSTLGGLAGIILAGPRVYYAMARDGLVFGWLGKVHPRFQTPHRALLLQAIWSSVLVLTGTYRELFTRVVYMEWIFFGLMAIGLFVLRRRPGYAPAYRMWGYPIVPAVFIVVAFAIVATELVAAPRARLSGLILVGLGLPVYYFWARGPGHALQTRTPQL
jgi:basic amino acid/polyamine antiporter, APA family